MVRHNIRINNPSQPRCDALDVSFDGRALPRGLEHDLGLGLCKKSNIAALLIHAIDATPARSRGGAGSSLLDPASTKEPDALVDFHTGRSRSFRLVPGLSSVAVELGELVLRAAMRGNEAARRVVPALNSFPGLDWLISARRANAVS